MTREEVIKSYEAEVPVLYDFMRNGVYKWCSCIYGYEVKHSENGEEEEKFFVILLDEKTKNSIIHASPERVVLAKRT